MSNKWKKLCIWTIYYDSLNKNTISLKFHNRTEKKIIIIEFSLFWEKITILVHFFLIQVLLTILVYMYCDHKVQETPYGLKTNLDSWINSRLSNFFSEMFSLQRPFLNWIVNIQLSIIYLLCACRVQSITPPLVKI